MNVISLPVYDRTYKIKVRRPVTLGPQAPRLVVVAYQPNEAAREILRLCIESIRCLTPEPHELWIVDNCSPPAFTEWLEYEPDVNVIYNMVKPVPRRRLRHLLKFEHQPPYAGSYANAVALEIAARIIDPNTHVMMTLHMDIMACRCGWLSYLRGHLSDEVRCVGVRMDEVRVKAVHVLGMMFDFTLFRPLSLTFKHDMPGYDVGDAISIALQNAGYGLWACRNTVWQPELLELLPGDSPFRRISVDRVFNDTNDVIFMHLGRGILKTNGCVPVGKASPDEWLQFGKEVVLAN